MLQGSPHAVKPIGCLSFADPSPSPVGRRYRFFIEGEGPLLSQAINKIIVDEEDSLPAPNEVLPLARELLPSRIGVPKRSSEHSTNQDELKDRVHTTPPAIDQVNTKWLPNNMVISIKKSRSIPKRLPHALMTLTSSKTLLLLIFYAALLSHTWCSHTKTARSASSAKTVPIASCLTMLGTHEHRWHT